MINTPLPVLDPFVTALLIHPKMLFLILNAG
jgi:hypothetical protein